MKSESAAQKRYPGNLPEAETKRTLERNTRNETTELRHKTQRNARACSKELKPLDSNSSPRQRGGDGSSILWARRCGGCEKKYGRDSELGSESLGIFFRWRWQGMKERKFNATDIVYLRAEAVRGKLLEGKVLHSFKRSGIYCNGIRWEKTVYVVRWGDCPYGVDTSEENMLTEAEAKKLVKKYQKWLKEYRNSDAYKNAPWVKALEAKKKREEAK